MKRFRVLFLLTLLLLSAFPAMSQEKEQEDSLVRLVQADTLRQTERNGRTYRRATGNAVFLHNNTYLMCDTAIWDVDSRLIEAIGSVRILQERTELESDRMFYHIDRDLAEFRGNIVQLRDKDNNTLRTRHLDYNTKDSVAVFMNGGSMRDKDGQIIESQRGTYDSKIKEFNFATDVNMFTDSIFVETTTLRYESDRNFATFGRGTNAWQEDNMLSADAGWYDRNREVFFFRRNVHVMSDTQEGWCDSLYFYRNTMNVDMFGNAQVTDTTRNVSAVAGHINYIDSLSKVTLLRKPAVIAKTEENGQVDTVYFGADTLIYYTKRMCDIDSCVIADANTRKATLDIDPVSEYRHKAAEEAARAAAEAAKNDPNRPPDIPKSNNQQENAAAAEESPSSPAESQDSSAVAVSDSVTSDSTAFAVSDSLGVASSDSLGIASPDSSAMLQPVIDTTEIGFVTALRNVKIYRKNMQIVCDSLEYSDLDSLARLFKSPVIWNEVTQQFSADSVTAVIRNQMMEKVSLMANAFQTASWSVLMHSGVHLPYFTLRRMMCLPQPTGKKARCCQHISRMAISIGSIILIRQQAMPILWRR